MGRKSIQLKRKFPSKVRRISTLRAFLTFNSLDYKKSDNVSGTPELTYGDGDGTVNARSLKGCKYLQSQQKQPIRTLEIPKAEHIKILSNAQTISYIIDVLL